MEKFSQRAICLESRREDSLRCGRFGCLKITDELGPFYIRYVLNSIQLEFLQVGHAFGTPESTVSFNGRHTCIRLCSLGETSSKIYTYTDDFMKRFEPRGSCICIKPLMGLAAQRTWTCCGIRVIWTPFNRTRC